MTKPTSVTASHHILDFDLGRSMGMITVGANGWNVSYSSGTHIEGYVLGVFSVLSYSPWVVQKHELDGQVFATQEDASRAAYNAGMLNLYYYVG